MNITHHADDSTLMSYGAGSLSEALAAVVAAHVAVCPRCKQELALMEHLGGIILSQLPPSPLSLGSRQPDLPRVAVSTSSRSGHAEQQTKLCEAKRELPVPLERLIHGNLDSIRWRRLGPGVWHRPLSISSDAHGDLRLIKVAPGKALPDHGHGGSELTLILQGSYTDEIGRFGVGDLADLDDAVEHKPRANPELGCICLIASEEKARFKGLIARVVQPFIGL